MSKTIKVIELLNKIANGEEVPNKIKYGSIIFNWDKIGYLHYEDDIREQAFLEGLRTDMVLNDEVEIIEEEPEIGEIGKMAGWALVSLEEDIEEQKENINFTLDFFGKKINEIITNQNKIAKAINKINNK